METIRKTVIMLAALTLALTLAFGAGSGECAKKKKEADMKAEDRFVANENSTITDNTAPNAARGGGTASGAMADTLRGDAGPIAWCSCP